MKQSDKRILTTHVSRLIRPPELRAFIKAAQNGESVNQAAHEKCLRQSVATAVRRQAQAGVDIVDDGEFGKSSWAAYVLERITGFELRKDQIIPLNCLGRDRERFREFFEQEMPNSLRGASAEVCVGPIEMRNREAAA